MKKTTLRLDEEIEAKIGHSAFGAQAPYRIPWEAVKTSSPRRTRYSEIAPQRRVGKKKGAINSYVLLEYLARRPDEICAAFQLMIERCLEFSLFKLGRNCWHCWGR